MSWNVLKSPGISNLKTCGNHEAVSEKELKEKMSAVENLQKDADKLAMDAAIERLDGSNDVRKTKKENESEIKELCKMLRKAVIV